jgi:hypothetical protein
MRIKTTRLAVCRVGAMTVVLALGGTLAGCPSKDAPPSTSPDGSLNTADVPIEVRFPWGSFREDLEHRYGAPKIVWTADTIPDDEFAAVTMREMVAARKPRPVYYQVFRTRRLDGGFFNDYVFFGRENRVIYVARREAAK